MYRWINNEWVKVDTDISLYSGTGQNTDGAMTQKATTDALALKANQTDLANKQDKLTPGDNITIIDNVISATDTTYSNFTGATSQEAGTHGLVPAPATIDESKFLKGDGSWGTPTDTTYTAGTGLDLNGTEFSVDTTAIQEKLTAGSNVQINDNVISATDTTYTAGSGLDLTGTEFSIDTSTVATQTDLTNGLATKQDTLTAGSNVQINNNTISATDTTYSNFTGTDGTSAGAAGLVPAPATTDAGKYLKADGTWDTVSAGHTYTAGDGIDISAQDVISATNTGKGKELTTDDYNYPTNNPSSVALWLLDPGYYYAGAGVTVRVSTSTVAAQNNYLVGRASSSHQKNIIVFYGSVAGGRTYIVGTNDGAEWESASLTTPVIDNLTSTSTASALSANQGKTLKDLIDSLVIKAAGAPTTSTVGTVGMLYEDTTNGKLYICTDATNPYVWEEVATKGYVDTSITTAISGITGVEFEVVQTLPATGDAGTIYLVPNQGTTPNIYDEYIYVNNAFEKIGTTEIDLSNYVTTTDLNTALADYTTTANLATVATTGSYGDLINTPATLTTEELNNLWEIA